jgi:putative membrane protein
MKPLFMPMLALTALVLLPALAADRMAGQGAVQDQKFFNTAMQAGMDEVMLGQMAAKQASTNEVKQFSQTLVNDHSKVNAALKDIGTQNNWQFSSTAEQGQWDQLKKAEGRDFDRKFMQTVIGDHQKAIALFEQESRDGSNADLKTFATNTLPHLRHHLEMARELDQKLAGAQRGMDKDRSIDVRHDRMMHDQEHRMMNPAPSQSKSY